MFQILSKCVFALLLCCFTSLSEVSACPNGCLLPQSKVFNSVSALAAKDGIPVIEVVMGVHGTAQVSWSNFAESGQYTIVVTDLTNSTLLSTVTTFSTSTTIGGMISGHTYRFAAFEGANVLAGTPVITTDVVMG